MSDDQVGCEWVSVSSGTGLPRLSRTKAVKRLCVCVCVRVRACMCVLVLFVILHMYLTWSLFTFLHIVFIVIVETPLE